MKRLRVGTNFTVFVIFFGLAGMESFISGNLFWIGFWIIMAAFFFLADNLGRHKQE